jgi:hypothetical protein
MKPYHLYSSEHLHDKTYVIDTFWSYPQGGDAWCYVDIYGDTAEGHEGPLVLTSDWHVQKPTEKEMRLIVKAWFEGTV